MLDDRATAVGSRFLAGEHGGIMSHPAGEVTSAPIEVCAVSAAFLATCAVVTAVRRTAQGSTTSASTSVTMTAGTVVPTFQFAITATVPTGTMTAVLIEIIRIVTTGATSAAYETAAVLTVVRRGD